MKAMIGMGEDGNGREASEERERIGGPFWDVGERREAAGWPVGKRQQHVRSILVRYPTFNDAVASVESAHRPVKGGTYDRGKICGLLGASRAGKSTAIKHYVRGLGTIETETAHVPRALYVDATRGMNVNGLADKLYAQLNLRRRSRGNAVSHLGIICDEIAEHGIEFVVIDDAQWLLLSRFDATIQQTLGFLVDLAERRTCNVMVAGLEQIEDVIAANPHAHGRGGFPHDFVEPFDWHAETGRKDFRKLLTLIGTYLPFRDLPNFADEVVSAHFYKVSDGLIGRALNYIEAAAYLAINDDAFTVEPKHLIAAAQRMRRTNDPFAPFLSKIDVDDPGEFVSQQEAEEASADAQHLRQVLVKKPRRRVSTKGRIATVGAAARPGA